MLVLLLLEEVVLEHRCNVLNRTEPLIVEVKESIAASADDMKNLYRKLVVVITLLSGLGNPTASPVLKEATGKKCHKHKFPRNYLA